MAFKVFVDGQEGTTGLQINEYLAKRADIEVLKIDADKRKDLGERKRLINASDVTFLCLPDDAARESVALVDNPEFSAWLIGRTPSRRWGDVQDLVGAAVFLASDASRFVNGHILYVDGGVTAQL